jgi:hypothetical protein
MPNHRIHLLLPLARILVRLFLVLTLAMGGLTALLPTPVQAEIEAWAGMDSLHVARFYHTATLLMTGKVLVTGGKNINPTPPDTSFSSSELYSPDANLWTATGSLASPRYYHTRWLRLNCTTPPVGPGCLPGP